MQACYARGLSKGAGGCLGWPSDESTERTSGEEAPLVGELGAEEGRTLDMPATVLSRLLQGSNQAAQLAQVQRMRELCQRGQQIALPATMLSCLHSGDGCGLAEPTAKPRIRFKGWLPHLFCFHPTNLPSRL